MFSSAAGPFQQQLPSSRSQTPFQRLKPICVELLSLAGRRTTTTPSQTQPVVACLRRLKSTLRALLSDSNADSRNFQASAASSSKLIPSGVEPTLSPSLISYVFYPLSELINSAPKGITSFPDSIAEEVLEVLSALCSQWWTSWAPVDAESKHRQVWCDLVILSSSVLGSPTSKAGTDLGPQLRHGDEVKVAALRVLDELLAPRFKSLCSASATRNGKNREFEWEWDGVSELPMMDDQPAATAKQEGSSSYRSEGAMVLVCPTPAHLSYAASERVAKGAISFVLSTSFAIAESSPESTEVRTAAINVARHALLLWIGGTCTLPSTSPGAFQPDVPPLHHTDLSPSSSTGSSSDSTSAQIATAQRLRPLLPGITSSLTRLATSRVKSKQVGSKIKPTPSPVATSAIELLGDLLRATISDQTLQDIIVQHEPITQLRSRTASVDTTIPVTDLEDFADARLGDDLSSSSADADVSKEQDLRPDGSAQEADSPGSALNKDAQWALSTLAQVHLALKTFSPLTQPSLPGTMLPSSVHSSVQISLLRLAVALLSECASSFRWLDEQLAGMERLDTNGDRSATLESTNSSSITTLLSWLIDLASKVNLDTVSKNTRAAFDALQQRAMTSKGVSSLVQLGNGSMLWKVLVQAFDSLPSAITAQNDASVSRLTLRISTSLDLLQRQMGRDSLNVSVGLAKLAQEMQGACVRLLPPLRIDRLEHVEETPTLSTSTTWRLQPIFSGLEASTSSHISKMFYDLGRALAHSLVNEIKRAPDSIKIDYNHMFSLITFLAERAARMRSIRLDAKGAEGGANADARMREESLTSLLVAADMLRGVSSCLDNLELGVQFSAMGAGAGQASKQARKVAHRLAKKVFGLVMEMLDGDAEEAIRSRSDSVRASDVVEQDAADTTTESSELLSIENASGSTLVERVKGISLATTDISSSTPARHGPALDLAFVQAADLTKPSTSTQTSNQLSLQHRFRQAEQKIDQSNALLFSLLSSTSKLLGQSFRCLLLRGAYPLISGMSASTTASSDLVRQSSVSAVKDIAFYTAYADVKNCLLDHADYILGAACQRLISGLDEELRAIAAGDALISDRPSRSMTRKGDAGRQLVVLPLISAQRAPFVLVEMIRVLGSEIIPMVEDAIDEILDAMDRFHHHPTICDGLLAVLDSILETMAVEQTSKLPAPKKVRMIDAVAREMKRDEVDVFKSWLEARRREARVFDDTSTSEQRDEAEEEKKEDEEDKPTKSQQVATQILNKASMFLTHPSPILRTRVLRLLQHGVETLAPQDRTSELLPIINGAWPFVMTRLGASYSNSKSSTSTRLEPIIDLTPSSKGAKARERDEQWYRRCEEALVERDAGVWVAAARFVEAAVKGVPDFVGKRVVEEAWPRFEVLLSLIRWKFGRAGREADPTHDSRRVTSLMAGDQRQALLESERHTGSSAPIQSLLQSSSSPHASLPTSTTHSHIDQPFILPSTSSLPAQLTLCIITTLTSVVRHLNARMPDDAAWSITTHPYLLGLLDARQPPTILRAAEDMYIELGKRNPHATSWAVKAAFPTATTVDVETPCYMHHARAKVHRETVHHLLDCFAEF
ncbi:HEAT repeat protein [Pseudozyma hubeiensis SY62]|uniref:HEAT repeat protein n=1 Tax=Pseudozyma hubeiensis (strain SY62) TaxID=1305764 RepID=R9PEV2_PSEHS|nr:HEAT repeat protein [Pseudozyma hubeiensis SY62]GAC99903.1 HEAT repeat protein [Pseudozyma hubeiensis SY62]